MDVVFYFYTVNALISGLGAYNVHVLEMRLIREWGLSEKGRGLIREGEGAY